MVTKYLQRWSSIVVTLTLLFAAPAYAHVLETDGTIGAVMHVDPGDQPVASTLANFYFDMKDTAGKFDAKECACTLSISLGSAEVFSGPLYSEASQTLSLSYVFPTAGVYRVELRGTSQDASFTPFALAWDLRVEPPEKGSSGWWRQYLSGHIPHLIIAIVGAIFVIGVIVRDQIRLRRAK